MITLLALWGYSVSPQVMGLHVPVQVAQLQRETSRASLSYLSTTLTRPCPSLLGRLVQGIPVLLVAPSRKESKHKVSQVRIYLMIP